MLFRSGDLSSRSSDISSKSSEISPDLVRSHQIRLDLRRICHFFRLKSTILTGFFTVDGSDRTDRVSGAKPTKPIRLPRWSEADQDFLNPVGLELGTNPTRTDPWTPLIFSMLKKMKEKFKKCGTILLKR